MPPSCRRAVHCLRAAPSITVNLPSCCPSPPITVVLLVHRRRARAAPRRGGAVVRRPSLWRSRPAVPCHQGAVAPAIAVKEPSSVLTDDSGHSSCPSKPLVRLVVVLPLLTPPPPICWRPSLWPLPFVPVVLPAGCRISLLLTPPSPICWCLRLSSRCHLLSCHAHLRPLVRLVKASPLLTLPPSICGIIESSQQSSLMLVLWSNIMLLLMIMASIINVTT